jgi:hypothetical protein
LPFPYGPQCWASKPGEDRPTYLVIHPFPQINIYTILTNLQFTLKLICRFIVRESAFCGNEVENLLVVPILADVAANQLSISYHTSYVWPALNQKFPLTFYRVHLFLFGKLTISPKNVIYDFSFPFPFISWSTTFTIPKNSSLVNIPFSISKLVRASCWTTWDIRSSSEIGRVVKFKSFCELQVSIKPPGGSQLGKTKAFTTASTIRT